MAQLAKDGAKDVTTSTFATEVLERSRSVPVVVDFWAPWCGPCRVLAPLLEREVAALGGRVELVKVNTDENPELATEFQTMSIPAVKAFRDGRVVDEFVGARPAPFLQEFLRRLAPSESKQKLEAALALYGAKNADAVAAFAPLVDDPEVGSEAAFRLAHALVDAGRAEDARAPLAKVAPTSDFSPRVETLERLLDFLGAAPDDAAAAAAETRLTAAPGDLDARFALAARDARAGRWADALEHLLESVTRKPKHADGAARKAMLAIFDHLEEPGRDPELAREMRRRLQIVT